MAYVIEGGGVYGLALHPRDDLKRADVVEPTGDIWVTDGDNSYALWRTKKVIYKDGITERSITTKFPAFTGRAARRYAEKLVPEGAVVGRISETGDAIVFSPVRSGEVVTVTRRWARDTRKINLLRPGLDWLGLPKLKKKDSYRINTADVDRWNGKNLVALQDAARRIMRTLEGRIIFAR